MMYIDLDQIPEYLRPLRVPPGQLRRVTEELRKQHGPIRGLRLLREALTLDEILYFEDLEELIEWYRDDCELSERAIRRRLADLRLIREIRLRYWHDPQH